MMELPHEVEVKFVLSKKQSKSLVRFFDAAQLGESVHLLEKRTTLIKDNYFDTPPLACYHHQACLRLRHYDLRPSKVTFKQDQVPLLSTDLSRRVEIEGSLTDALAEKILSQCPWLKVKANELPAFENDAYAFFTFIGLFEMFRIHNYRTIYVLKFGDAGKAELSIDRVSCMTANRAETFYEMEIELIEGPVGTFDQLVTEIRQQLPKIKAAKYKSKYEHGLRLLGFLDKKEKKKNPQKIWMRKINRILKRFNRYYKRALKFKDIEDLHQARVSLRQFLTLLDFLRYSAKRKKDVKKIKEVMRIAKRIQKYLGRIRDLDVFIHKIQKEDDGLGIGNSEDMLRLLQKERETARLDSLVHLPKLRNQTFQALWAEFNERDLPKLTKKVDVQKKLSALRQQFQSLFEKFVELSHLKGRNNPETLNVLHSIRILSKKLRYAYQYVAFALQLDPTTAIQKYTHIQDELGELNDLYNFRLLHEKLLAQYGQLLSSRFSNNISEIDRALEKQMYRAIKSMEKIVDIESALYPTSIEEGSASGAPVNVGAPQDEEVSETTA